MWEQRASSLRVQLPVPARNNLVQPGPREVVPRAQMSSLSRRPPFACALLGVALALLAPSSARAEGRKPERPASTAKPREASTAKPREASTAKPRGEAPAARAESSSEAAPKQDPIETCLEDHARGQELRLGGKLIEARDAFLHCSATHCPNQIQRDCSGY